MENWVIAVATVVIGLATIAQVTVAWRLYELQQSIERAQRRVYVHASVRWIVNSQVVIKLINASATGVVFSTLMLAAAEPDSDKEESLAVPGVWVVGPFSSEEPTTPVSLKALLRRFDIQKPKRILLYARFFRSAGQSDQRDEALVFYGEVYRDAVGNIIQQPKK